ncbi:MAG TPA: prolyl oligopeptidase family serine peptidase [Pirellulales bacterium]|nr:prolyl oligopeptidase family serine peptidase [Pirellulales bacterium]
MSLATTRADDSAPAAAKEPVVDTYHGVAVSDDYRWLEDWNDPKVQAWSDAQNAHARGYLDRLPNVEAIRARLTELETGASSQYSSLVRRGGRLFALKHEPPKQQPLLVWLSSAKEPSSQRIVVDPNRLDSAGHTSIDWFVPSLDGRLVAVSLSEGGSESGTVHVYQTDDGKELDADRIPRVNGGTAGGSLSWGAGNAGFYYTRYPRPGERSREDLDFYQQVYFHRLGTPTEKDVYEIGRDFPRIAEVELETSGDGRWVLASVQNGDGGEFAHYVRSAQGGWTQVTRFEDRVVEAALGSDEALYLISRADAPRGKVLRLPLQSLKLGEARCIVPESEVTIVSHFGLHPSFVVTPNRLYLLDQVGGPNEVRIFDHGGRQHGKLPLPELASVGGMLATEGDDVLFQAQTFIAPAAWYAFSAQSGQATKTDLFQTSPADYQGCEVVREWATSKDGTRVPVSIIRRKGLKLDGRNPTVLNAYGGYGVSVAPRFSPTRQLWLEQGGVFAIANLRGGGEFGEAWHRAGNLANKQNVFDDFYAVARHLVDAGYTSADRLAIMGGSNGGLLMGATFTQHPELCRAVVSHVGIYDMLRVELSPNGAFNVTEFGTVKDKEQFKALYAYSPYHHVDEGTKYPAILFLTGANDPRVDPMQSRKMTARLQAASPNTVTLLRTSAESGHGIGNSLVQRIEEGVDVYSFLFHELGMGYEPRQTTGLPRSTPEEQGVSSSDILAFVEAADRQIDSLHSFMLVRHGHVVAEGWWSPYDAYTRHSLFSLSKSFTSTAVGLAIAEGKLHLDDEVLTFLADDAPAEPSANLKAMRVSDLLRMSTGQQSEPQRTLEQPWTKTFLEHPVPFKPGTHFLYNTSATYMLSAIVQKATGMTVLDYLRPRLFDPLGISDPTWEASPQGISVGGYGLSIRTEDIARFGQLFLQKGQWQGKQLVPAGWVESATSRQTSTGSNPNGDWDQGYGYQFWRCRHGAYRGDGAFGQFCVVLPEHDAVIAITSGVHDMQAVLNLVWDKLLPAFKSSSLPAHDVAVEKLNNAISRLSLRTPEGNGSPGKVEGKRFVFPANEGKLETLAVAGDGDEVTLVMRVNGAEQRVVCGQGRWCKGQLAWGVLPEHPVAASGDWTAEDTFTAKFCFVETPFTTTVRLKFDGDEVKLTNESNVSFGPPREGELVGKAE